jgi:predicted nucleic acid-binding protein
LCQNAGLREIFYLWRPVLDDPKDDFLLELAVESNSNFIVTFNIKDFAGIGRFGIKAIRPNQFLEIIDEIS